MKILFLGDIVGKPGREIVAAHIGPLRDEYRPDLVIANGENAAGGFGITPPLARQFLDSRENGGGIDVLTLGNHTWSKNETVELLETEPRVLRPANYPPGTPGRGCGLFRTPGGVLVGVANVMGRVFMEPLDDPFRAADEIIGKLAAGGAKVIFIDFHAETTSEKVAFGWHCDGRVSAVIGTHTHVPTADERVLPGGTAYQTDAGMCGPENSVIGMDVETVLAKFRTQRPHRFNVAEKGPAVLNGVLIDVDEATGKARSIERIRRRDDGGYAGR